MSGSVFHVARFLYGEKSAGRARMQYLDRFLRKRFGAVPIVADRCVYQVDIRGHHLVIGTFVDDISYFGTSQWIVDYFLKGMKEHFGEDQITGGTVADSLLGIKFDYDDEELDYYDGELSYELLAAEVSCSIHFTAHRMKL